MKRLSTGVLAACMVAGLGLTAVAAPSGHASQGNIGTTVIAQASPAASPAPAATAMASPAPAASGMASPAPAASGMASPAPAATAMASAAPAAPTTTTPAMPPMQFGSPPSGTIPILFNDHHVYAKPDVLKQGRVLAALVRGGTILVPLRSMFEQMGATVSYDPGSKTVDVTKAGSDVKVTLGKPEVVVNGETRPLDVPPMMYQGQILVPVRVISEGMGAYVQWVPDKRVVVVRYVPATPPPPPATPAPVSTPAPTPTPVPVATPYQDHFIAGDYIISPKVYNEFSPGNTGSGSYAIHGALEFNLFNLPWMIASDFRRWQYPHNAGPGPAVAPGGSGRNRLCNGLPGGAPIGDPGCVTTIGGQANLWVPAFTAQDQDVDVRLGLKVLDPHIYIGVGYLWRTTNYGYPQQNGFGFGLQKLPDLNQGFSVYGSVWYYPNVKGTCGTDVCPTGPFTLAYNILKYQIGGTIGLGNNFPIFLDFGWLGDNGSNKQNAPIGFTHNGPYVGLGIHF